MTMPALEQIIRILFLLLASCLFLLVDAALAGAQGFENLAFAISLMICTERFLAQEFELPNVGLQFFTEVQQVFAQNCGELEVRGGASGAEPSGIGLSGVSKIAFQLRQSFLSARDLEIGFLQIEGALALDALT